MSEVLNQAFHNMVDEQPHEFRVNTGAYRGRSVFEAEMDRIFYRSWVYLCHESEVQKPGDYKATQIGTRPVIVAKDRDGKVYASLNACPHRGATVCREEKGNTRAFVCPYHGWSFRPSGQLIGIPDEDRYPAGFCKTTKNLKAVPRVEAYGGLIFGSFDTEIVPLDVWLGGVKRHIDLWLDRAAGGKYRVATSHKYGYDGNWKFQTENIYDGYHPGFVHGSAFRTLKKFDGTFSNRALDIAVRQVGHTRGFPGGHGTLEAGQPLESAGIDPIILSAYKNRLKEMHGEERAAEVVNNRHFLVFPNLAVFDYNIRVIQPISHDRTDICSYPVLIDGVDQQINTNHMLDAQTRVGTAGILSADDIDVFAGAQNALRANGSDWITLSRGLGKEDVMPDGERVGAYSDETPQRAFWRQWHQMMAA